MPHRRLVEIRAYRLKPGTRADFHAAATSTMRPMVRAFGMDVRTAALHDDNGYLVRSFASLAELTAQEDEFYGLTPWREGPRESLVPRIDTYVDTLLWLSPGRDRGSACGQRAAAAGGGRGLRPARRVPRRRAGSRATGRCVHAGVRRVRAATPRAAQVAGVSPAGAAGAVRGGLLGRGVRAAMVA